MKRDFLTVCDLTSAETMGLLHRAIAMKEGRGKGPQADADSLLSPLAGKSIGLLFEKSSTRTRLSFEVGVYQLGAQPVVLNQHETQLGRGESVADTARVFSRYLDAVVIRTYEHQRIIDFATHASVPLINALTDDHHPCQALADAMTVLQARGTLEGVKMAYIGDGNNVAQSLIEVAARTGMSLSLACPEGYEPDAALLSSCQSDARGEITVVRDPAEAAAGADVLYTDVWVSMGQEDEARIRREIFRDYQINAALLKQAKSDAIVMHCLPAYRGFEITDDVIEGPHSVVFDQAENRLHAQKALMEFLLAS